MSHWNEKKSIALSKIGVLLFMLLIPFSEFLIDAERVMLDTLHEILLLSAG